MESELLVKAHITSPEINVFLSKASRIRSKLESSLQTQNQTDSDTIKSISDHIDDLKGKLEFILMHDEENMEISDKLSSIMDDLIAKLKQLLSN